MVNLACRTILAIAIAAAAQNAQAEQAGGSENTHEADAGKNYTAQNTSLSATRLTRSAVGNRAASVGSNSGDTGAWVNVLHDSNNQGSRGGVPGYDANSDGLIIGADGKLNEWTSLGLAFSHVRTNIFGDNGNDTDVNTDLLSAYGSWEQGSVSVLGTLTFGKGDNELSDYLIDDDAKADYDSTVLAADLSAGYTFALNENLDVISILASRYSKVKIYGFSPEGSPRVDSQSLEVFDVGAGFKLEGRYGDFKPNARLMAFHDFAQDSINATLSRDSLQPVTITGAPATRWTYEAGVGLEWTQGQYTLGASYDYTRKADFNADSLALTGRYDF